MKVYPSDEGIFIEPETEFETMWLSHKFMNALKRRVILKSGTSLGDVVGLVITVEKKEKVDG